MGAAAIVDRLRGTRTDGDDLEAFAAELRDVVSQGDAALTEVQRQHREYDADQRRRVRQGKSVTFEGAAPEHIEKLFQAAQSQKAAGIAAVVTRWRPRIDAALEARRRAMDMAWGQFDAERDALVTLETAINRLLPFGRQICPSISQHQHQDLSLAHTSWHRQTWPPAAAPVRDED